MNNDIKIIFVDIDFTIFDGKKFDIQSIKALRTAQEKHGIKVFFATARPYESALRTRLFDFINPDGVVSCNGAVACIKNEIIYHDDFPSEIVKNVIETCNEYGLVIEVATPFERYFTLPSNGYVMDYFTSFFETVPMVKNNFDEDYVNAMLVFAPEEFDERLSLKFDKRVSMIRFTRCGLDLRTHEISKADGISAVMGYYGFSKEQAMAIGDSFKGDFPMFQLCKYSVAMGESKQELKEKAYFVTKSLKKHGCKYALKKLNVV